MAIEIGALRALLSLDSAAFDKGAKRAQASMNGLQRSLTKAATRMRKVGKTMSTRVTAPFVAAAGLMVRSSLSTVDAQAKFAQSLGTTTSSIQTLTRAADMAGISQGDLDGSLRRMTRRISLAEQGAGAGAKAFARLGIEAKDLADLDAAERIKLIQQRIADLVPAAEQAAVASQVFGDKTGLAMLRLDAATIDKANDELKRFGVHVADIDADKIEEANDAMSALGLVTKGLGNQLAVALAPSLKTISERIADVAEWFSQLSPKMKTLIATAGGVAVAIGPLAVALGFVATGIAALASPIGLAVLAFGALAGVSAYVVTQWDDLRARFPFLEKLAGIGESLKKSWEDLPAIKWALLIPVLRWAKFIPGLKWASYIPRIGWIAAAGALKWGTLIARLSWVALRAIPVIGWAALAGQLAWTLLVKKIEWGEFGLKIEWAEWVTKINWSDWIPQIDWGRIFGDRSASSGGRNRGRTVGRDISQGLAEGISDGSEEVDSAVKNVVDGAEGTARDVSETQSPSRVWMRIGRDLMSGLGVGISENATAAASAAAAAAKKVTDSTKETLDAGRQKLTGFFDDVGSAVAGAVTQGQDFGDAMRSVFQRIASDWVSSGVSSLFSSIFGGASGGALSGIGSLFAGFFDGGGRIPTGKFGIAGENGPEIVTGPASVVSTAATSRVMDRGAAGGKFDFGISFGETGGLLATIRNEAGQVVAQAEEQIVGRAVSSVYASSKERPIR